MNPNSIGSVQWDLVANIARISSDAEQIKKMLGGAMNNVAGAVDIAKKAFIGLFGAAPIAGFASLLKGAIDSAEALHDLSQSTGASVESLSAFAEVGRTTGTSADTIAGMMTKLAKNTQGVTDSNSDAARALKALGIDFQSFQRLSPDQQMLTVAKAMDSFADGSGKAAAAQILFGKEGAKNLPFMHDLAQTGELVARTTDAQSEAADQFNDNMTKLRVTGGAWIHDLAMGMVPALGDASQAVLDVFNGTGGLREEIQKLGADGTIAEWTKRAVIGLTYVMDAVSGVKRVFQSIGEYLGASIASWVATFSALGGAISKATSGDFKGAWAELKGGAAEVDSIMKDLGKTLSDTWSEETVGQKIRARMEEIEKTGATAKAAKPPVEGLGKATADSATAADKSTKAYAGTVDAMHKYVLETQAAVKQNANLTEGQKLVLRAEEMLKDAKINLTAAERRYLEELVAQVRTTDEARRVQEAAKKAHDDTAKALDQSIESLQKQIEQQQESNVKTELGAEALAKLEIQKLRDAAATADRNALLAGESQLNSDLTAQYINQAKKLRELADLKEQGVHVEMAKQANEEWQKTTADIETGLTDSLFRAAEEGKSIWGSMRDAIKGYFNNLVLKPVISAVMQPVAGAIGSLLGGGSGSGTGSILGSLGNIVNLGKSLLDGSAFTKIGSMIGGSISKIGASIGGNVGSALGSVGSFASTAIPIAGAIAASISLSKAIANGYSIGGFAGKALTFLGPLGGLINRAFGRRPKEVTGTGIEGAFAEGDFSGQQYADWQRKGGWFRSTKRGTDYSALDGELAGALDQGGASVYASVAQYAKILQMPADALASVNYKFRVAFGKDEAETEANITKALSDYQDALSEQFASTLAPFKQAGESVSDTLLRLSAIQTFSESINQFGGIFTRVAQLSLSAREELIGFAGSMENFIAKAQSFVQNYYTDAEQYGLAAKDIRAQLDALGITQDISSKADFRSIVEAVDVSTTAGREQLNALLDLAQAFAPIAQYIEDQKTTLGELADKAPSSALLESVLKDQETQAAYQEQLTGQVDQLNGSILGIGDLIADAIASGNELLLAALQAIASQTAATAQQLKRWDDDGALVTTTPP